MTNEEYLRVRDVARRLGVTRDAVYKWIRQGKLQSARFGDNAVRIPRSSLEEFEKQALRPAVDEERKIEEDRRGIDLAVALTV